MMTQSESEFHWVEVKGKGPALNLTESAQYVGRSYSGFTQLLRKFSDVKQYSAPHAKAKYILKSDLDKMTDIQPIEE